MDSFESGLFLSCSTPAPKKSSTNPFKPGNSFRSEQVDNTKGNASIYLPWTNFGTLLAAIQQTNSNSRLAKPIKLPDDYHGRTCLRGYLRPCERCAVINGWTAEESAGFLSAALRDEAQKIAWYVGCDCGDYLKLLARIELRFGVEKQTELFQARLHNRRQQECDSLKALASDIRNMVSLAY